MKAANAKTIVSYAKRDWSKGNVYYKLGFKFIGYIAPGYFWANSKGETFSCEPTEDERNWDFRYYGERVKK